MLSVTAQESGNGMLDLLKNLKNLIGQNAMLKGQWKILTKCSHYRDPKDCTVGGTEYCNLEDQEECMGEIRSCQNPEVLREYLLDEGLGWEKRKRRNRCKRTLQILSRLASACWR
jgi:hypothetical protein